MIPILSCYGQRLFKKKTLITYTQKCVRMIVPQINWAKYLDHAFSGIFKNEFEFDEDDTVVVLNWEYFLEASLLLSKTDSRIIGWFIRYI